MLELIDQWLLLTGPWILVVLAVAALLEYVFPPFPGDTVTMLGAYAAVQGDVSFPDVFVAVTAGSLVGASISYGAGRVLARAAESTTSSPGWLGRWSAKLLPPELMARVAVQYRRYGPWIILANRFVPVTRSIFFVFAGMTGISYTRTLILGGISAMAWNSMLLAIGYSIGANRDALAHALDGYTRIAWGVTGLVILGVGAVMIARKWKRNRLPKPGESKAVADSKVAS